MAKKKFHINYDAPVTLTLVLISTAIFILDSYVCKGAISQNALICYGSTKDKGFDYSNALSYVRIFAHIFYASSWTSLLTNAAFLLLLGPVLEERYGSIVIGVTIFLSTIVSGVLATFSPLPLTGPSCLIFMMIVLSTITSFEKKNISLSSILIFILYCVFMFHQGYEENASKYEGNGFLIFCEANVSALMNLAAGLIGSLAGFLTSPKGSRTKKSTKAEKTEVAEEEPPKKEKPKKFFGKTQQEEETFIGSIEL